MKFPAFTNLNRYLKNVNRWFPPSPDRSLDAAYDAALTIKAIEDEYFGGQKIAPEFGQYGESVMAYFQSEQQKYLKIAKTNLANFLRASSQVSPDAVNKITETQDDGPGAGDPSTSDASTIVLEKLKFIDEVLDKYSRDIPSQPSQSLSLIPVSQTQKLDFSQPKPQKRSPQKNSKTKSQNCNKNEIEIDPNAKSISDQTSFLPRSILKTINRIKRELDPTAEKELIDNFRTSKTKTFIALRFILILILVPLLAQQLSKNFIVSPIVDSIRSNNQAVIFINLDLESEAFEELKRFQSELEFQDLIFSEENRSSATIQAKQTEIKQKVKERAVELSKKYRDKSANAIKNIFADLISVGIFAWVIFSRKRDVLVLKSFMDEIVYGLSDSAKAFIIILFTDTFVGYHSPHGWEIILEGVSRHLGLPENRGFIFLFIATFPVILDTVLKYWIFRYLNRISPSAVATYRNMNES